MSDILQRVAEDGKKAVKLFLPSIANPPKPPPPPPNPMAQDNHMVDVARALKRLGALEKMSYRAARGLPPDRPPTPEEQFGNVLDVAHTRALSRAIANHPEEEQGRLIAEAHDSATKWIAAHNGKVVVHGKIETATSPEAAEKLAQKIVNDTVQEHDERESGGDEDKDGAGSGEDGNVADSGKVRPNGSANESVHSPPARGRVPTPAAHPAQVSARPAGAPGAPVPTPTTVPMEEPVDAPPAIEAPSPEVPPESTTSTTPEETPQIEASAVDSANAVPSVQPDISGSVPEAATPALDEGMRNDGTGDAAIPISRIDRGSDTAAPPRPNPGNGTRAKAVGRRAAVLGKGTKVKLRDGRDAEVQWHHPPAGILRVKVDGKNHMIRDGDLA